MGISAFKIIGTADGAFNINEEFFASDLEFPDVPEGTVQIIQVQLETDQAALLEVTTNGGLSWAALNNATAISGMATFTMMVRKDDALNFRNTDVAGLAVKFTVAE